ncbi:MULTISPECIES: group I truncated hemoglobin [Pseudomonas]|uniref:Group 1 truncated hemoglobin n=1 Tax=Pseudomonas quercus TaxID=2722792 RepID=A0ABX0YED5_9PSED|nr:MULTISPECIES: group 1 truncated hemoglobin [Pseudomonas]MBF7143217.1 group 1 truncated hemoglobin [Pseudomonas sp. LY10J]NJP01755.1 group 1 truncated hemoglobin [Pseudomonas quercus]NJP03394.1 group 1 truncated hemoglobin [Pseudomonas quercus]
MRRAVLVAGLVALLSACTQAPVADDSLYQALGGKPGITRIVEGMLLNVARDPRIVQHFRNVDPERLRSKLVEKFCVEAGGPCTYTGDTMAEAHKGQQISPAEFNALVENLMASMDSQGVPTPVQNRLLARLAAERGEVIRR